MSKNLSSPIKVDPRSAKERAEMDQKLKSINDRLHKVHEERKKMSPLSKYSIASKSTSAANKKMKKRALYHPRLDFIIAETCYSPYLTSPYEPYSEKTLRVPMQVKELRFSGSDVNAEGFPVEMKKAKKIFIKDIIEYKAHFEFHEEKTNLPMQYIDEPPEFFIPGVHSKPRPDSMVFPNNYVPLKGHTGRLPHLEAYLKLDPNRPKTSPPVLARAASIEDCEKLLADLERNRPGTAQHGVLVQGSGPLKAHAMRGGPNKYREEKRYHKAVQELRRAISSCSVDFDEDVDERGESLYMEDNDGFEPDEQITNEAVATSPSAQKDPNQIKNGEERQQDVTNDTAREQWEFDIAVVRIKRVAVKNLKSDSVFGKKSVFATLKFGKIWNTKTSTVLDAPNPCEWVTAEGDKAMALTITPESVHNMRLGVSVFNANKVRADTLYGTCKLEISDYLQANRFEAESSISCELTNKAGEKTGRVTVVFDAMRQTDFEYLAEIYQKKKDKERALEEQLFKADVSEDLSPPTTKAKKPASRSTSEFKSVASVKTSRVGYAGAADEKSNVKAAPSRSSSKVISNPDIEPQDGKCSSEVDDFKSGRKTQSTHSQNSSKRETSSVQSKTGGIVDVDDYADDFDDARSESKQAPDCNNNEDNYDADFDDLSVKQDGSDIQIHSDEGKTSVTNTKDFVKEEASATIKMGDGRASTVDTNEYEDEFDDMQSESKQAPQNMEEEDGKDEEGYNADFNDQSPVKPKQQSKDGPGDHDYSVDEFDDMQSESKQAPQNMEEEDGKDEEGYNADFNDQSPVKPKQQSNDGSVECEDDFLGEVITQGCSADEACLGGDLENSHEEDKSGTITTEALSPEKYYAEDTYMEVEGDELSSASNKEALNATGGGADDLHEPSIFYDLSADDGEGDQSFEDIGGGLDSRSMMLGESGGLLGLGVGSALLDGGDSKNTMTAVIEDMIHEESAAMGRHVTSYEDEDFIYDDDDDDGSYTSAEIIKKN